MPTIMKLASLFGDEDREYVPLSEYKELEDLIKRFLKMELGTDCDRYENLLQSGKLEQLLKDCQEAL